MVAEGHTVASLTGGIEGSQRDEIIDKFRSGEAKVLITTNVLARGIDVSTVSMVINYVSIGVNIFDRSQAYSLHRISPSYITRLRTSAWRTSRRISTVLAGQDDLAGSECQSRLCPTGTNG